MSCYPAKIRYYLDIRIFFPASATWKTILQAILRELSFSIVSGFIVFYRRSK